ncbi:MAG TPA: hypothetical protein VEA19_07780 [Actinomycetota bacterium]|nr:hypothetical protein [Actinomycetota bacterium]
MGIDPGLRLLRERTGIVPLDGRTVTRLRGADARDWASDLLTAEVRELEPGRARAAMLLTPTGRVRAVVTVACLEDDLLLVQDDRQPDPISKLLAQYVLSSRVELTEEPMACATVLDPALVPSGLASVIPSTLGPGADVFAPDGRTLEDALSGLERVSEETLETWRIEEGLARFPVDLATDSLPHEVEHGDAVEDERGCYLGQEAVARVRNLGHPPRVIVAVRSKRDLEPGAQLSREGEPAGEVTSAAGSSAIARLRWASREGPLTDGGGGSVELAGPARLSR